MREYPTIDSFHVSPDISAKKERNARKAAGVPNWEEVVALVDCTVFGSAKDALVFGREGLYFESFGAPDAPAYQPWTAVALRGAENFSDGGMNNRCRIGDVVYQILGDREALCTLINATWGLDESPDLSDLGGTTLHDPAKWSEQLVAFGSLAECYVVPDIPVKKERNARRACGASRRDNDGPRAVGRRSESAIRAS